MAKNKNNIQLRYEEQIYDVEFRGNTYKLSIIQDLQYGDCKAIIIKYNTRGELINPTDKQKLEVIEFFNENN